MKVWKRSMRRIRNTVSLLLTVVMVITVFPVPVHAVVEDSIEKETETDYVDKLDEPLRQEKSVGDVEEKEAMEETEIIEEKVSEDLPSAEITEKPSLTSENNDAEISVQSESSDFAYKVLNGTYCEITGYTGSKAEVAVPSEINGYIVQNIARDVFKDNKTLTAVEFPETVETMGSNVFAGCIKLKDVRLNNGLTNVGDSAFNGCTALESITLPSAIKKIGSYAFYKCTELTDIKLPDGLTMLGQSTFRECTALINVELPDSVSSIGYEAFYGCSKLSRINYPVSWSVAGRRDGYTSSGPNYQGNIFGGCSSLTKIEIPEGVTEIPSCAFSRCTYLEEVVLPDTLTAIGTYAFNGCNSLKTISLPESLSAIGIYAFNECAGLKKIEIPGKVEQISKSVFEKCTGLTSVIINEGTTTIGDFVFYRCSGLTDLQLPEGLTMIGNNTFRECTALINVELPNSVSSIGYEAFYGCSKLSRINYPVSWSVAGRRDGYTSSGPNYQGNIFGGCSSLTKIEIPEGVTEIPSCAFSRCTYLEEVVLPDTLNAIGTYAFNECTGLKTINLLEGLTVIPDYCFYNCPNLSVLTLPATIESINKYAFYNCFGLRVINMNEELRTIGSYAFYGCDGILSLVLNKGVEVISGNAFANCANLNTVEIPDSVIFMETSSFSNCSKLKIYCNSGTKAHVVSELAGYTIVLLDEHEHEYVAVIETAPTCTRGGSQIKTCSICGYNYIEILNPLGHKQGNWVVLTEPTCTKEGIKILSCTVCGEQLEKAYLEAYGHTEGDWETTEGSCTEGGFRTKHCIVCNVEIARENLPATGHMWSEWKVESKASVLSEGRKSRTCSVCQEKEEIVDPRKEIDYTTNTNYGLANFTIVDAVTLKPVPGACVLISTEAEGDGLLYADKDGILSQVVPTGIVNISVYIDNYNVRNISVTIYPGENDIPAIGISRNNLVDGKLTSSEMTYEEMIEAGIDVGSPGNHHVYKYELKLEFEAQIDYLSLFYYMNPQTGKLNVYRPSDDNEGDSGESSGSGKGYRAELIIDPFAGVDEGKGVGTKYTFDDGQVVSVYPISEVFYLVIRGEVGWVKEMYDVELMAINNSMTDTVSNAVAELMLPEGLSLATMKGEQQTLLQYIGELAHGESKSIHWYVRGDEEGSYSITAKLSGTMLPFGDSFEYTYTTASPIHVYAGSAMHLRFYVPDAAFTGEDYTIRMELENVSNKILYHVSHRIMDIEQYRITYYSNETQEIEDYPVPSTGGMAISIDKFYPGDKLIMEVPIEIFFESELIQAQMDNLLKSMRQFQNLYNNYKAVATGLNLLMDLIDFISGASANLDNYVGSLTDNSVELKRSCIKLLDEFSKLLSKCTDSSNSEVLEAISKLKSGTLNGETNLWDVLQNISDNPAVLNMMTAAKIADIASRLKATVDGIDSKKESFGAYEAMEKAMELIPIRYVLKSSSITTLQNSSTEIPTSVVVTPTGERFFGVESVGDYLYNSIIVSFGENIETESFIKNWGFDVKKIMGYEEAVEYLKIANEKAAHILASDNTSKGTFKAWYEPTVRAYSLTSNSSYELTVDNENAQWKEGKLTFTGPGMISLVPHNETGGTLYVEDPEGNVKAFEIEVVEAHTCASDEWDVLVAPSDETDGVKAKCCSICDDVIAIESMASCSKHKYGEYESDMTATLEASGIQVHTCVNCGAMEYRYTDAYSLSLIHI